MGSWSEACGFSGIEIAEGETAYICLINKVKGSLNDGAFHHYAPHTTLLRGMYNDYGYLRVDDDQAVLDVFNSQAGLELKNGDDFSLDMLNGKPGYRWWMHGAAFDFMPTVKQEFGYHYSRSENKSIKVENIGASADLMIAEIRAKVTKGTAEHLERMTLFKESADNSDLIVAAMVLCDSGLRDVYGYGSDHGSYYSLFQDAIKNGQENIDGLIEAYRRYFLLAYSMSELRKTLAPCESTGPQHGGEVASKQFANFILVTQKDRASR